MKDVKLPAIERREYKAQVEVRAKNSESRKMTGHAAVFGEVADVCWFRERVEPGAFKDSIIQDDVRALWNHDPNYVLGRNVANTLSLVEDDKGLAVEISPPDTQWSRDLQVSMERGDVSQMSFGFQVLDATWETEDGEDVRVIRRVKLFDVSVVTFPAYASTDASLRSAREIYDNHLTALKQEQEAARGKPGQASGLDLKRKRLDLEARAV